ncbi:MAG: Sua5/YciO/YrdC/YwlC family protein [Candidatus Thiodiazotropha sp. L084R]
MSPYHYLHPWHFRLARKVIHAGGLIAYPTEAVFGLGCHPLDGDAVLRLLALKQRPAHKGLILIADRAEALYPYLGDLPTKVWERMIQHWPGPTTWVVPASKKTPKWLTGRHNSLAVRVTDHPLASALCKISATPLVSTSANISQHHPARSPLEVHLRCGHGVDLVLHGQTGGQTKPTVIRDALSDALIRA